MSDEASWSIALVLGLVVAVATVALLEAFLRQVHRIERDAGDVWQAGKEVARNTATTWLLPETSKRLDLLTAEALRHVELLSPPPAASSPAAATPATTSRKVAR